MCDFLTHTLKIPVTQSQALLTVHSKKSGNRFFTLRKFQMRITDTQPIIPKSKMSSYTKQCCFPVFFLHSGTWRYQFHFMVLLSEEFIMHDTDFTQVHIHRKQVPV